MPHWLPGLCGAASAGGPPVQLDQVPLGAAPVQPGVAEMMTDPVRINGHPALAAAAHDHLIDAVRHHRPPVVHSQPLLRPVRLGMPCPDPDVTVEADGGLVADPDNPRLTALAP